MIKKLLLGILVSAAFSAGAQTYTFTTAGAAGRMGPTQLQVDAAYTATSLDGAVTITTQGIQEWTVPTSGMYQIQAAGAVGGASNWSGLVPGGNGSTMTGDFNLTAGQVLTILVGQAGETNAVGAGGGGSFVAIGGLPTIVAGGGGGASSDNAGVSAVTVEGGTMDVLNIIAGGVAGNGGNACTGSQNNGGGGGGFYTDGVTPNTGSPNNNGFGGLSFLNGGVGGLDGRLDGACDFDAEGGFGGGGSTSCNTVGGAGGGGYSGGAGGIHISNCGAGTRSGGGGGGSINNGTNQSNIAGNNSTDGTVTITLLCSPTAITPDSISLANFTEECSATPIAPTATNDCSATIVGVPDIVFPVTTPGTTVVTWTFDDGLNTTTQTQNVILADITGPTPDSVSLVDLTDECSISALVAPIATDNCSGIVTVSHDATLPITAQGTTVVTWTFLDETGNTSIQTQNVILTDVTDPVADSISLADITACVSSAPVAPTATDNCFGLIDGTPDLALPITTPGLNVVTWTFTDANGNSVTQTQNVTIVPVNVGVTLTGPQLSVDVASTSYQWLDCDNAFAAIPGETNQTFTATVTGNYAAIITQNGCTDTSACMLVDFTALNEIVMDGISVYPNPSVDGNFTITSTSNINAVEILDIRGRALTCPIDLNQGTVDGSKLEMGKYLIRIRTDNGVFTKEVIIIN